MKRRPGFVFLRSYKTMSLCWISEQILWMHSDRRKQTAVQKLKRERGSEVCLDCLSMSWSCRCVGKCSHSCRRCRSIGLQAQENHTERVFETSIQTFWLWAIEAIAIDL